jgi:hypothetical protein
LNRGIIETKKRALRNAAQNVSVAQAYIYPMQKTFSKGIGRAGNSFTGSRAARSRDMFFAPWQAPEF